MGVVYSGDIDALAAALDHFEFVHEHANAHVLQRRNHSDRVVIAEHAV